MKRLPEVLLVLALVGCDAGGERQLSVLGPDADTALWVPHEEDTGHSGVEPKTDCAGPLTLSDPDALTLDQCIRYSPEPPPDVIDGPDDGGVDDPGTGDDQDPYRCGFYNLIGAVTVIAGPKVAAVMYCDSDLDGGMRSGRLQGSAGDWETHLLADRECWPDPDSGDVLERADGRHLAAWANLDETQASVWAVMVDPTDGSTAQRQRLDVPGNPIRVRLVDGAQASAVVLDNDGDLWSIPSSGDDRRAPVAHRRARTADAAPWSDATAVAWCEDSGPMWVGAIGDTGELAWTTVIDELECDLLARVSVATLGEHALVGVRVGDVAWLVFVGRDGVIAEALPLGAGTYGPAVSADGTRFVALDASGAVTTWTPEGEPIDRWLHPAIAEREGSFGVLRLDVSDARAVFALVGSLSIDADGHQWTHNFLEVSTASIPVP